MFVYQDGNKIIGYYSLFLQNDNECEFPIYLWVYAKGIVMR